MNINHVLSAPALGLGKQSAFTDFNFADVGGIGRAFPGFVFEFQGAKFQVVQNRAGGNLVVGEVVSLMFSDSSRTGNLATGVTTAVALTDDTHDTLIVGDPQYPSEIVVTAGALATTGTMQRRAIKAAASATTASTVTVALADGSRGWDSAATSSAEVFTGTPDNTWDYTVFAPWEVVKADLDALATSGVQGYVVSTVITDNYYGIIQLTGVALALVGGTTDVLVGDFLMPDSTAGSLSKWVVGAPDATGVTTSNFICARALDGYTDATVALRRIQIIPTNALIPYF